VLRKIVVHKPGGYAALSLVGEPWFSEPLEGYNVEIEVMASGVNFADIIAREGLYEAARGRYPLVLGFEFAGWVRAVGAHVKHVKIGQRVWGYTLFGAYASRLVVPSRQVRVLPARWSFEQGAAIATAHLEVTSKNESIRVRKEQQIDKEARIINTDSTYIYDKVLQKHIKIEKTSELRGIE
jgi:synaptic vesicle membrane protein VAT-1